MSLNFLPSFDNANSRRQGLFLRFRSSATMATWRHNSPFYNNYFYSQSQQGAEPVEDRCTLHATWPGVNCTPVKFSSLTVMDWTLSVILLTSAIFKIDDVCDEVVFPFNPSLSSFLMLFNFKETGDGLIEVNLSLTQIFGSLFSSVWPVSMMELSICGVDLCCTCCSVMWLCSCASDISLGNSLLLFESNWTSFLAGLVWRLCRIFCCSSSVLKGNDTGLKSFVEVFPTLINICDVFLTARWEEDSEDGLAPQTVFALGLWLFENTCFVELHLDVEISFSSAFSAQLSSLCELSLEYSSPGGVLHISLGGEVQRGPSYPDPV